MEKSKELSKGVCPSCWGKKYYTQLHGEEGFEDFGGEGYIKAPEIHKYPCSKCNGTGKYEKPSVELSKCCNAPIDDRSSSIVDFFCTKCKKSLSLKDINNYKGY